MQRQTVATTDVMQVPAGAFFLLAEAEYPVNLRIFRRGKVAEDRAAVVCGYSIEGEPFEKIEIRSGTTQSIGVLSAQWKEGYTGATSIVQPRSSNLLAAGLIVVVPAALSTVVAAQNLRQKAIVVQNIGANLAWLGGAAASDLGGFQLPAGASVRLETSGQVSAYSVAGTNITVLRELYAS